jgi:hypothetical protein
MSKLDHAENIFAKISNTFRSGTYDPLTPLSDYILIAATKKI